jgi:hypothetical protein
MHLEVSVLATMWRYNTINVALRILDRLAATRWQLLPLTILFYPSEPKEEAAM